jgi:phage FluMu protein gp41
MSDTSVTTIEKDITWIKGHVLVVLLAVALIAGSIIGGVSLFEGMVERHDERKAAEQQRKEGIDTATQAAFMAQLQQEHADNLARDAAQTTLINSLVAQMAQQRAATAKQLTTDSTLDAKAAAARLSLQTKAGPTDVTTSNDTVTMTLPITRTVVADLDLLTQAQSDVTNLQSQLGAQKILTSDSKVELADANKVIAADKTELIATIKGDNAACDLRVDKQADKDRKRGLFATIFGVLGGMILRGKI